MTYWCKVEDTTGEWFYFYLNNFSTVEPTTSVTSCLKFLFVFKFLFYFEMLSPCVSVIFTYCVFLPWLIFLMCLTCLVLLTCVMFVITPCVFKSWLSVQSRLDPLLWFSLFCAVYPALFKFCFATFFCSSVQNKVLIFSVSISLQCLHLGPPAPQFVTANNSK